jgi:hypothetical protein
MSGPEPAAHCRFGSPWQTQRQTTSIIASLVALLIDGVAVSTTPE